MQNDLSHFSHLFPLFSKEFKRPEEVLSYCNPQDILHGINPVENFELIWSNFWLNEKQSSASGLKFLKGIQDVETVDYYYITFEEENLQGLAEFVHDMRPLVYNSNLRSHEHKL